MSQSIIFFSEESYFDLEDKVLICGNSNIDLTAKELEVLKFLAQREGRPCENSLIYQDCWNVDDLELDNTPIESINNAVKNVVKQLRAKLKANDEALSDIIQTVVGTGYKLVLPSQINRNKTVNKKFLRAEEYYILGVEEYRKFWVDADMLFIKNRRARNLKKYFYTDRKALPTNQDELELGLAIAEFLRDTISYSEILLGTFPELADVEDHFQYKHLILGSRIAKMGMLQFRFSSETLTNLDQDTIRYTESPIDIRAVVATSKIFLEIDRLFIDHPDVLALRKYFYDEEWRGKLPEDYEQLSLGLSVCEFLKDQFQYSEPFLPYIPEEYVNSYYRYRNWMLQCQLMEASRKEYTFPWETRL